MRWVLRTWMSSSPVTVASTRYWRGWAVGSTVGSRARAADPPASVLASRFRTGVERKALSPEKRLSDENRNPSRPPSARGGVQASGNCVTRQVTGRSDRVPPAKKRASRLTLNGWSSVACGGPANTTSKVGSR